MQVLTNGVWVDLPIGPQTEGSWQEIRETMIEYGYRSHTIEIGSEGVDTYLKAWSGKKGVHPQYYFDVGIGGAIIELGAATFTDYINLLERMTQLVHNAFVTGTLQQFLEGNAELEELLIRVRRDQKNG